MNINQYIRKHKCCANDAEFNESYTWFGIKFHGLRIPKTKVLICNYCAEDNFMSSELYPVLVSDKRTCCMEKTKLLSAYDYNSRTYFCNGFQFNIIHIESNKFDSQPYDFDFHPTDLGTSDNRGEMIVKMPNNANWRLQIRLNNTWRFGDGTYLMRFYMISSNDVLVETTNALIPLNYDEMYNINGYRQQIGNSFKYSATFPDDHVFEIKINLYKMNDDNTYNWLYTIPIVIKFETKI